MTGGSGDGGGSGGGDEEMRETTSAVGGWGFRICLPNSSVCISYKQELEGVCLLDSPQ